MILERLRSTWQHMVVDKLESELLALSKEKETLKEKAISVRIKYENAVKALKDK